MSKQNANGAATKAAEAVVVRRYRIYTKDYNYKFNAASPTDAVKKAIDRQIWLENITDVATYGEGPEYISKVKLKVTPGLQAYQDFIKKEVKSGNQNYPNRYLVKPAHVKKEKPAKAPKADVKSEAKATKAPAKKTAQKAVKTVTKPVPSPEAAVLAEAPKVETPRPAVV